jgi:hypothetical protein
MRVAPIDGFDAYRVTEAGDIETKWRYGWYYSGLPLPDEWRVLHTNERSDGYLSVELRDGKGTKRRTYVHILVAEAFHGKRPFPKACVRHLDGQPGNNHASNLAWGSYKDNEEDKRTHGTWAARFGGKLTEAQRQEIRERHSKGERPRLLAAEFEVSRPTVTRLLNGTTWKAGL